MFSSNIVAQSIPQWTVKPSMIAMGLTYDNTDINNVIQWTSSAPNELMMTPEGMECNGYNRKLLSNSVPDWLKTQYAPLLVHVSAGVESAVLRSTSEMIIKVGKISPTISKIALCTIDDKHAPAYMNAIAVRSGNSNTSNTSYSEIVCGRPFWKWNGRLVENTHDAATGTPYGIVFLDENHILTTTYYSATKTRFNKIDIRSMTLVGEFTSTTGYRNIAVNSAGELWASANTTAMTKIDLEASLLAGTDVVLGTVTTSAIVAAFAFFERSGTEYFVQSTAAGAIVVTPSNLLVTGTTITTAQAFRRPTATATAVAGMVVRDGVMYLNQSHSTIVRTGVNHAGGNLVYYDLEAFMAGTPVTGTLVIVNTMNSASAYVHDCAIHPVTRELWTAIEGYNTNTELAAGRGYWINDLTREIVINHYTIFSDGGELAVKINNLFYKSISSNSPVIVDQISIGGDEGGVTAGYDQRYLTGFVRNVVVQNYAMTDAQYQHAISGGYETRQLKVYKLTVVNNDAEIGTLAGWTLQSGTNATVQTWPSWAVPAHKGVRLFRGGATASSIMYQTIDLASGTEPPILLSEIASGNAWLKLRWWQSCYDRTEDPAGMGFRTIDSADVKSAIDYSPITLTTNSVQGTAYMWNPRTYTKPLAVNTAKVDVLMRFDRSAGMANDGSIDDIEAIIYVK